MPTSSPTPTRSALRPQTPRQPGGTQSTPLRSLIDRITRLEIAVGAGIAAVMAALVVIEPNILEAPFENGRTLLFTFGGTALAALAFGVMLFLRVPPVVRVLVLVVPFTIVNWWLISPYFVDNVVDEQFETSIAAQLADAEPGAADAAPAIDAAPVEGAVDASAGEPTTGESTTAEPAAGEPDTALDDAADAAPTESAVDTPAAPVLLGAGQFVGLAGHDGVGDAGIFQNPDGSYTLRFENFDIENGPDLEVYLVPGADQVDLAPGSIHLGELKGNVGNQSYEIDGVELPPGEYTVLVWCEAFSVEFVGATVTI